MSDVSEIERAAIIRSTINSLALSGIVVDEETAARLWAEVEQEPLPSLGDDDEHP